MAHVETRIALNQKVLVTGFIYILWNTAKTPWKPYVGQTYRFLQRMNDHAKTKCKCPLLVNAVKKYGWENFHCVILRSCLYTELDRLEIQNIATYNSWHDAPNGYGYNCTQGGKGTYGYNHTPEDIEKIREAANKQWANREIWGSIRELKNGSFEALGPPETIDGKRVNPYIGVYNTRKRAEEARSHYIKTGEKLKSDRKRRKCGTGSNIPHPILNGLRWRQEIRIEGQRYRKIHDTYDEGEAWLKQIIACHECYSALRTAMVLGVG